jgi:UPF0755 protein
MKRSAWGTCLLTLSALTICLLALGTGWIYLSLLPQTERSFGPPGEQLTLYQRIYLSSRLFLQKDLLKQPANPLGETLPFQVKIGDSVINVVTRLEQLQLISSAKAMRDYLVYAGLDTTLQAGEYKLSSRMTPVEIALSLQDATPGEVVFGVLSGWRLEEIAAALPTSGLNFSPDDFLSLARNPTASLTNGLELPAGASLEGYLFPDNYRLPRQIALEDFLLTLLENFQIKVDSELTEGFNNQGLARHQAVTLASIVQREAVVEDEMPLIASVFINRLSNSMKLDSDPTVQYAHGFIPDQKTWWKNPLTLSDLEIDSPYNTYIYTDLPPGPISNPGLNALLAVAFPAKTPYFYFRMACDGSGRHSFAENFAEHLSNGCP